MNRVRIKIEGGVAYPFYVPDGVSVEIIDYDVEGSHPDECESYNGELCQHWVTEADGAERECEYDSDAGFIAWEAAQTGGGA